MLVELSWTRGGKRRRTTRQVELAGLGLRDVVDAWCVTVEGIGVEEMLEAYAAQGYGDTLEDHGTVQHQTTTETTVQWSECGGGVWHITARVI